MVEWDLFLDYDDVFEKVKIFFFEKNFFYHYFIELGLSLKSFIDGQESFIRIIEEMKETRYCKMLL